VHTHDAIIIPVSLHYLFVIYHLVSIAHWSFHPFSEQEREREREKKTFFLLYIHICCIHTMLYRHPIVILMMNIGAIILISNKVRHGNNQSLEGEFSSSYPNTTFFCIVYVVKKTNKDT